VWWDLTRPDDMPVRAAEVAARQAGERAALERVLHEPTMIVERGLRVPPFVAADRRAGLREDLVIPELRPHPTPDTPDVITSRHSRSDQS
jgi:hypothetical protein